MPQSPVTTSAATGWNWSDWFINATAGLLSGVVSGVIVAGFVYLFARAFRARNEAEKVVFTAHWRQAYGELWAQNMSIFPALYVTYSIDYDVGAEEVINDGHFREALPELVALGEEEDAYKGAVIPHLLPGGKVAAWLWQPQAKCMQVNFQLLSRSWVFDLLEKKLTCQDPLPVRLLEKVRRQLTSYWHTLSGHKY